MNLEEHAVAVGMVRKAEAELGISKQCLTDLFEMYLEDVEEYSEYTALEKLETGISDTKHKED